MWRVRANRFYGPLTLPSILPGRRVFCSVPQDDGSWFSLSKERSKRGKVRSYITKADGTDCI